MARFPNIGFMINNHSRRMKSSLRGKLLLYILTPTILIFFATLAYIILTSKKVAVEESIDYVNATARESANIIKTQLDSDMATLRTIATLYQSYPEASKPQQEEMFDPILGKVLRNNPQFISVWTSWEFSAIKPGYSLPNGRLRITYINEDGVIRQTVEALETDGKANDGIYYNIKNNPRELMTEPYYFFYQGKEDRQILETSACIPVMIKNKYAGLVGADIEIKRFFSLVKDIKPFEGSYILMMSDQGTIIAGADEKYENTSIENLDFIKNNGIAIHDSIALGRSFLIYDRSGSDHHKYISFVPFDIGKFDKHWYIAIVVPEDTILAEVNLNAWISTLAGLLGSLIIAFLIWLVANKITKPLKTTTSELNTLSTGNIDEVTEIKLTTHDELAEMGKALNKLLNSMRKSAAFAHQIGIGNYTAPFSSLGKKDMLGNSLMQMRDNLILLKNTNAENTWKQESLVQISELLQGDKTATDLGNQVLSKLAAIVGAQMGAIYVEENDSYHLISSYAFFNRKSGTNKFKLGEGLIGQAALEGKTIAFNQIPDDYILIKSGLGESKPAYILVVPLIFQKQVVAVMELAAAEQFSHQKLDLISQISESLAIAINTIKVNTEVKILLNKTQEQAEELRAQQEELLESNKVLEEKTNALRVSEEELQQQQEELRVTNEELIEKTKSLEEQKADISEKNLALENARNDLERKAEDLAIASKYKSEFLANMSHELRTPLNSLLILSDNLAQNKNNNLTSDQVESAEIIYKSGSDLLNMINDILDLSKIESGKMTVNVEPVSIKELSDTIFHYFKHVTQQKGLDLEIIIDEKLPQKIDTDRQKVEQIIKNFMSNAIKFTAKGKVSVKFEKPEDGIRFQANGLQNGTIIAISVTDSGIGIPLDKQKEIFEAFKQADGSISRKYGGTGLGLSISRELAKLLGGEIQLVSTHGEGSTFTFYLPATFSEQESQPTKAESKISAAPLKSEAKAAQPVITDHETEQQSLIKHDFIPDDMDNWNPGDKVIIVIEDDPNFAKILVNQCHDRGFKCIASATGEHGYELAVKTDPIAIILDINLPGIDGWKVLDLLKDNPATRHIPVHIMSGEDETIMGSSKGAIGYLTKPARKADLEKAFSKINDHVNKKVSNLLLVEDDENLRKSIKILIADDDVNITDAVTGMQALDLLRENTYECMILDLGLSDMSGFELIEKIESSKIVKPPIIIYTGKDLTKEENDLLQKYAETIIIKGVKSEERLLDETALFMHRVISDLPANKQKMIKKIHSKTDHFQNKKVLIVDDDMRNIFALTKVLSEQGMKVSRADNGQAALDILEKDGNFDILLIDIMMPVMDGYETIKRIRSMSAFKKTPVIALTAKAMKEDRQKCIDAGASDYMAKPLNIEKLLSLLRVWLYK